MTKLSLYKKTHLTTGLQYLGYTSRDPHTYKGSGKYWIRHIKKHGNNVCTEVLYESTSKDEIKDKGLYYSALWDVVNDPSWANLKDESGSGGAMGLESRKIVSAKLKGKPKSPEHKANLKGNNLGRKHSDEVNAKKGHKGSSNGMWGQTHSGNARRIIGENTRKNLKGKTYEEIYGPEKAAELKLRRTEHFRNLAKKRQGKE